MSAKRISWFLPEHTWASDLEADAIPRRVNPVQLNPKPQQHDQHVQRSQDHKASLVLEWMQMQRYDQDHR